MKGEPVPDSDHVVRYVGGMHIDRGVIHGGAFVPRRHGGGLSVNWLECFLADIHGQLAEVRRRTRLRYGASALLARLPVGRVKAHVAENAPDSGGILVVQDPLDSDPSSGFPVDPSHALIEGIPSVDHAEGEMIGDLIAQCIQGVFPARASTVAAQPSPAPPSAAPPTLLQSSVAEAGGILTIDLAAIEANWKKLYGMTVPVECAAVVKGDGYGLGLEPVTARLAKAGCTTFFVADLGEGRRVRALAPEAVIYVLNGLPSHTGPAFAEASLRPVLNSSTELAEWDSFTAASGWRGGAALHIDTGMHRLGFAPDEAAALAPRIQTGNHGIALIMSHLACADTPEHPLNDKQVRLFREVRVMFRGLPSSLANSSGIFMGGTVHCDLVRPGMALYGANPTPGKNNPMHPVVELKGRILQVRHAARGDSVGYGASVTAARASRIAIVGVGYGDGYLRAAGAAKGKPAAEAIVSGQRCPLIGRVSMDLLAVDVTDLPDGRARRGDLVTLIGGDLGVDELGAACGTVGYEMLTSLGRRYHRVYK